QPHYGGELGIQYALLGGLGRRAQPAAIATQCADSRMDAKAGGGNFRLALGGLARRAEIAAACRRRGPRTSPRGRERRIENWTSGITKPVGNHDDLATWIPRHDDWRSSAACPEPTAHLQGQGGHGGAEL